MVEIKQKGKKSILKEIIIDPKKLYVCLALLPKNTPGIDC